MAEHNESFEFSAIEANEILAERQRGWTSFTTFLTVAIGVTVLVLLMMLVTLT